jgi:hypothetical protein
VIVTVSSKRAVNDRLRRSALASLPSSSRTKDDTPRLAEPVKVKSWSAFGTAVFAIVIVPQLVTLTSIGRMKSFMLDENASDDRLLT